MSYKDRSIFAADTETKDRSTTNITQAHT